MSDETSDTITTSLQSHHLDHDHRGLQSDPMVLLIYLNYLQCMIHDPPICVILIHLQESIALIHASLTAFPSLLYSSPRYLTQLIVLFGLVVFHVVLLDVSTQWWYHDDYQYVGHFLGDYLDRYYWQKCHRRCVFSILINSPSDYISSTRRLFFTQSSLMDTIPSLHWMYCYYFFISPVYIMIVFVRDGCMV